MKKFVSAIFCFLVLMEVISTNFCSAQIPKLLFQKKTLSLTDIWIFPTGKSVEISKEKAVLSQWEKKDSFILPLASQQKLVTSDNGQFYGIINYNAKPPHLKAESFVLFDSSGNKKYELKNPEANSFLISPDGKTVVGVWTFVEQTTAKVVFYDETGKKIKEFEVPYFQGVYFSPSGNIIAIHSGKEGFLIFNSLGEKIGELGKGDKISFSWDGKISALSFSGNIKIFSEKKEKGNINLESQFLKVLVLSPDGKYLLAGDKKSLFLIEVENNKSLWEFKMPQKEMNLISGDISPNANYIVLGIDFDLGREVAQEQRHTKGLVFLLDKKGKKVWEKELSYKSWNAFVPEVKISPFGDKLSIKTKDEIWLYALE